ncbi:MAG: aminoglycoside phosphotransferase family protein [Ilumatobacter sp.]|uniref:phosphotransferase enzyme family protein n=1 Tax=Ilumatobacter sp. TaxID=1967498 RepID=UPI00329998A3
MTAERAFVDERVADVRRAASVADLAAETWGLGRPVLIRHGMNVIFASRTASATTSRGGRDDVVIRVSSPSVHASCSIELAASLAAHGVPVVAPSRLDVVEVDGLSATAWEYVAPSGDPIDWRAVGAIVRRVHEIPPGDLPVGVPTPSPAAFPWWDFERLLDDVAPVLDDAALAGITAAVERRAGWDAWNPSDAVVCHGDVHPGNVIMTHDGPVLIDWDLLCIAPPGWDHAPLMTWTDRWGGEPGVYEAFGAGAGGSLRGDERTEAFAELRLVAATLMRVKAAMADPSARLESERRLTYWRGDPEAPAWSAQ